MAPNVAHAAPKPDAIVADGRVLQLGALRASKGVFDLRAAGVRRDASYCVAWSGAEPQRDLSVEADGGWSITQDGIMRAHAEGSSLGDFRFVRDLKTGSPVCLSLARPAKGPWRARLRFFGPNLTDLPASPPNESPSLATPIAEGLTLVAPSAPGVYRIRYRSRLDGQPREAALYVPADVAASKSAMPAIVALHGMNGSAMAYLRYVLGGFDEDQNQSWHDRTPLSPLPDLHAIVIAPTAFGNAFYRGPGEEDVMDALAWVRAHYTVDAQRISITGASMGGTGAASIALHYPHVFSRIQSLCGYHSYFTRSDVPTVMAPWERFLAEERSNTAWAPNAFTIPLHLVQGTKDLPLSNGRSLVNRFTELGLSVRDEWPALGHNVWGHTYANLYGASWLLAPQTASNRSVRFRTARMRYHDAEGIAVLARESHERWSEVQALWADAIHVQIRSENVAALQLAKRTPSPLYVTLDGKSLVVPCDAQASFKKTSAGWELAPARWAPDGPFMDVYHTPITVVYGTSVPALRDVSKRVAEHWARKPSFRRWNESEDMSAGSGWATEPGVQYSVVSDTDFIASGKKLGPGESVLLVGNEESNKVLAAFGAVLRIRVKATGVTTAGKEYKGAEVGALCIYPRPDDPTGYIAVVGAPDAYGLQRSLSAPDLLPDYMVYDAGLSPSATNIWLGDGKVLRAGFYRADWSLPAE